MTLDKRLIKLVCIIFLSLSFSFVFSSVAYSGNGEVLAMTEDNNANPSVELGYADYVSIHDMSARKIMSWEAADSKHTKFGTIQDLLIHDEGKLAYVVVSLGGIFDIEDSQVKNKLVAIPVKKINMDSKKMEVILNVTKKELEQSDEFQYGDSNIKYAMSIANLLGMNVVSADEDKLGTIEDLLLTVNDKVNYAIVAVDSVLGLRDDKLVAAPFNSLQITMAKKQVVLPVTEKQLKNAPEFQFREP